MATVFKMKEITKEQEGVYESVIGKKLSTKELNKIHKEATTSFEEQDKKEFRTFIMFIITCLIGTAIIWAFINYILK